MNTIEHDLLNVDEEKLPVVLAERLELLEKTNKAYDIAKTREKESREKVGVALANADALITRAKGVGGNRASSHSFLGFEWTTKSDEIEAIKTNLKEMVECGIESAEAQRELVEVQSALAESQTALLNVQETQMAYQGQIADATKFLYGLSAYNMASVQSVLINLEAILSGASKEKLGEMAQQQLFLAMDQLKNQESIILQIRENKKFIETIDVDVANHEAEIKKINKKNLEQDDKLDTLKKQDDEFLKKGLERDKLIQAGQEHDKKQDLELKAQAQKDEEHDRLIQAGQEHDKKQDLELKAQAQKDEEHDRLIQAGQEHDKKQDLELKAQAQKDEEHDKKIIELMDKSAKLQKMIDEQITFSNKLKEEIELLKYEKTSKKSTYISYAIAGLSLILAVVQFFF